MVQARRTRGRCSCRCAPWAWTLSACRAPPSATCRWSWCGATASPRTRGWAPAWWTAARCGPTLVRGVGMGGWGVVGRDVVDGRSGGGEGIAGWRARRCCEDPSPVSRRVLTRHVWLCVCCAGLAPAILRELLALGLKPEHVSSAEEAGTAKRRRANASSCAAHAATKASSEGALHGRAKRPRSTLFPCPAPPTQ